MRNLHHARPAPQVRTRAYVFLLMVVISIFGFLFYKFGSYIPVLYELLFKKEITLQKTDERVNILLLGIGGGKHDGPLLTDTIIYMSIDAEKKKVTLVSLPRDLWAPDLQAKINTAYSVGETRKEGGGLILTKAIVEKVTGQPVDYALRVDFGGFVKAIDMVGGLDIDVERGFEDKEYPVSGKETDTCGFEGEEFEKRATEEAQAEAFPCRYEHLTFEKGQQHMDGETALRFVRSRHAEGVEGTDFARSKRQEKVISAFKDKVFSAGTFLNPIKLISLHDIFKDSIDTDIKTEEYDDFIKLARKMEQANMASVVLDYGNEEEQRAGLLENPEPSEEYKWQWVIVPRLGNGDFSEIHAYVKCEIEVGNCSITPTKTPLSQQ